jgi:hypothetical protein
MSFSYQLKTFTYIYQATYGSPEVDQTTPKITRVEVGADGKSVRLYVSPVEGHIHDLKADGVRSKDGIPLLHPQAYYTLNIIPTKSAACGFAGACGAATSFRPTEVPR